jgi:hypothetical protein
MSIRFIIVLAVIILNHVSCYKDQTDPCKFYDFYDSEVVKQGDCGYMFKGFWSLEVPVMPEPEMPVALQQEGLKVRVYVEIEYDGIYQCNADTSEATVDYRIFHVIKPCKIELR